MPSMRLQWCLFLFFPSLLFFLHGAHATSTICDAPRVPLYRAYSAAATDHVYTIDATELQNFIKQGYKAEGVAAYVFHNYTSGAVPLYRLRMTRPAVNHFYTTNITEANNAVRSGTYVSEGVECHVLPEPVECAVPFYRAFLPAPDFNHFYTASSDEFADFVLNRGYRPNMIAAYVLPTEK